MTPDPDPPPWGTRFAGQVMSHTPRPPGHPHPGHTDPGEPPARIAFCGPGRTFTTALTLALAGETAEIRETAHLPDPDAIYVITRPAFPLPPFAPR